MRIDNFSSEWHLGVRCRMQLWSITHTTEKSRSKQVSWLYTSNTSQCMATISWLPSKTSIRARKSFVWLRSCRYRTLIWSKRVWKRPFHKISLVFCLKSHFRQRSIRLSTKRSRPYVILSWLYIITPYSYTTFIYYSYIFKYHIDIISLYTVVNVIVIFNNNNNFRYKYIL